MSCVSCCADDIDRPNGAPLSALSPQVLERMLQSRRSVGAADPREMVQAGVSAVKQQAKGIFRKLSTMEEEEEEDDEDPGEGGGKGARQGRRRLEMCALCMVCIQRGLTCNIRDHPIKWLVAYLVFSIQSIFLVWLCTFVGSIDHYQASMAIAFILTPVLFLVSYWIVFRPILVGRGESDWFFPPLSFCTLFFTGLTIIFCYIAADVEGHIQSVDRVLAAPTFNLSCAQHDQANFSSVQFSSGRQPFLFIRLYYSDFTLDISDTFMSHSITSKASTRFCIYCATPLLPTSSASHCSDTNFFFTFIECRNKPSNVTLDQAIESDMCRSMAEVKLDNLLAEVQLQNISSGEASNFSIAEVNKVFRLQSWVRFYDSYYPSDVDRLTAAVNAHLPVVYPNASRILVQWDAQSPEWFRAERDRLIQLQRDEFLCVDLVLWVLSPLLLIAFKKCCGIHLIGEIVE